jgi:tRNA U34 5-carboxymethylaminomethyl modifying enzyme MnmG/GidA
MISRNSHQGRMRTATVRRRATGSPRAQVTGRTLSDQSGVRAGRTARFPRNNCLVVTNERGHVPLESVNPGTAGIGAEVAMNRVQSLNSLVDKVNHRTPISLSTLVTTQSRS